MTYHSHVLNIPHAHPFDNEHRWTTFLGEFVRPLVAGKDFLFWFSYYGDFARFRIYAEDYDFAELDVLREKFGLTYKLDKDGNRMEANATLEGDLGWERFLGAERTDVSSTERGLMVLRLVHAGAQLFLSTLVRDGDYWREEICENGNNPFKSSSYSYIHLLHNLCMSDVLIWTFRDSQNQSGLLSEYYFQNAVETGELHQPIQAQNHRIRV